MARLEDSAQPRLVDNRSAWPNETPRTSNRHRVNLCGHRWVEPDCWLPPREPAVAPDCGDICQPEPADQFSPGADSWNRSG